MKKIFLCFMGLFFIVSCSEDPISLITLEEGEAFLAKNASKEGVKTIEQGLQYSIIEAGNANSISPSLEYYNGSFSWPVSQREGSFEVSTTIFN